MNRLYVSTAQAEPGRFQAVIHVGDFITEDVALRIGLICLKLISDEMLNKTTEKDEANVKR